MADSKSEATSVFTMRVLATISLFLVSCAHSSDSGLNPDIPLSLPPLEPGTPASSVAAAGGSHCGLTSIMEEIAVQPPARKRRRSVSSPQANPSPPAAPEDPTNERKRKRRKLRPAVHVVPAHEQTPEYREYNEMATCLRNEPDTFMNWARHAMSALIEIPNSDWICSHEFTYDGQGTHAELGELKLTNHDHAVGKHDVASDVKLLQRMSFPNSEGTTDRTVSRVFGVLCCASDSLEKEKRRSLGYSYPQEG